MLTVAIVFFNKEMAPLPYCKGHKKTPFSHAAKGVE
jgi:hypothetical protein